MIDALGIDRSQIRSGVESRLLERERSLRGLIASKAVSLERQSGSVSNNQLIALNREIEDLIGEYRGVEATIRNGSHQYGALTSPKPVSSAEIQSLLDTDTVLLEYSLGAQKSFLWVVTNRSVSLVELAKRSEISTAARRVYEAITSQGKRAPETTSTARPWEAAKNGREILEATSALSRLVLSPVAGQLENKRVIVVADGALQYIPFGCLPLSSRPSPQNVTRVAGSPNSRGAATEVLQQKRPDPPGLDKFDPPLIESHEIVTLPSAATLLTLRREAMVRQPAPKTVAVIADPVFAADDARLMAGKSEKSPKPEPLPIEESL